MRVGECDSPVEASEQGEPYRTPWNRRCAWCDTDVSPTVAVQMEGSETAYFHPDCRDALVYYVVSTQKRARKKSRWASIKRTARRVLMRCEACASYGRRLAYTFLFLLGLGTISLLGVGICSMVTTCGKVDRCYVKSSGKEVRPYSLMSHVWGSQDRHIGNYEDLDGAMKAAERLGCPVK